MKRSLIIAKKMLSICLILIMSMALLEPITARAAQKPCLSPSSTKPYETFLIGENVEISFLLVFGGYEKETYRMNLYYGSQLVASADGDEYLLSERERTFRETLNWDTYGYPPGMYWLEVECYYYEQGEWKFSEKETIWNLRLLEHGTWIRDHVGWWFKMYDGSYPYNQWKYIDNVWYYFDASGYMVTGWRFVNGHWYYFNPSGAMMTGWILDRGTWYFLNRDGDMATGWQYINGHWYYFNGSGAMLANRWVGYYYLTSSGAMATNRWIDGYYVGPDGCRLVF